MRCEACAGSSGTDNIHQILCHPSHKYQGDVSKKMCKVELLFCSERDNFIFDFPLNDAVAFFLKHYLL